ncbi:MAG: radical SAM family heme chaperone HemW [Aureliella sp.]
MQTPNPRSAYIHVPFCNRRCGYCNFTLLTGRDDLVPKYLDALQAELASVVGSPQEVDTIFLGGGTPSYLRGAEMQRLQELIAYWFPLADAGEYSCEVNPVDCQPDQLEALAAGGVTRVSIGGQSFDDAKLSVLQRDHSSQQLSDSINACSEVFGDVSLDLIFAAPDETLQQWQSDVAIALQHPITHLSTYCLTVERGSAFFGRVARNELQEVDEDTQLAMYSHVRMALSHAGWEHYEVSNFSLPGHRCRHNETYWIGSPWWAVGPGAASYLPQRTSSTAPPFAGGNEQPHWPTMLRRVNHRSTTTYIRRILDGKSAVHETEVVEPLEQLRERLVFGLRRLEGVDILQLNEWWGSDVLPHFQPAIQRFVDQNLLKWNGQRLSLTSDGLVISDSLWPALFGH